jgi:hypothetical protein
MISCSDPAESILPVWNSHCGKLAALDARVAFMADAITLPGQ